MMQGSGFLSVQSAVVMDARHVRGNVGITSLLERRPRGKVVHGVTSTCPYSARNCGTSTGDATSTATVWTSGWESKLHRHVATKEFLHLPGPPIPGPPRLGPTRCKPQTMGTAPPAFTQSTACSFPL